MYTLTKLSKPSLAYVASLSTSSAQRSAAFNIAAAYSIARNLSLPPGQVDELVLYFRLQHEREVLRHLDTINEMVPVDAKAIKELVLAFYQQRYAAANPVAIPLLLRSGCELEDLFGVSKYFPEDFFATIKEQGETITRHISGLFNIEQDLKLSAAKDAEAWKQEEKDHYVA